MPRPLESWEKELQYIACVYSFGKWSVNSLESFNDDPECFKRYVRMQASSATREGFDSIGAEILRVIGEVAI